MRTGRTSARPARRPRTSGRAPRPGAGRPPDRQRRDLCLRPGGKLEPGHRAETELGVADDHARKWRATNADDEAAIGRS